MFYSLSQTLTKYRTYIHIRRQIKRRVPVARTYWELAGARAKLREIRISHANLELSNQTTIDEVKNEKARTILTHR